jgi:hypothetical protein
MIRSIKRALGLVPSAEQWDRLKSQGLERLLGKEHGMVMHALIPFHLGGSLDLYYYPQQPGFAIATKELIDEYGTGPRNRVFRAYEFAMFSRVPFDLDKAQEEGHPMEAAHSRLQTILNALARYAPHATLNPRETMEFPADFGHGIGGQCLILDAYTRDGSNLQINGKDFGLMLAITIHPSEMRYARANGGEKLITLLKQQGVYPSSDVEREAVV